MISQVASAGTRPNFLITNPTGSVSIDRAHAEVMLVEDDPVALESLAFLLDSVGLRTRRFASAEEFLSSYEPDVPGCLVVDVRLREISGLELQERLRARMDTRPVIVITGHGDVQMVVRAMKSGAIDFLEKPFNAQVLLERVEMALRHDAKSRSDRQDRVGAERRLALLTTREAEVVKLVVDGKANKEIAHAMGISRKTVELHRAKAMRKLGAKHVSDMVRAYLLCATAAVDSQH